MLYVCEVRTMVIQTSICTIHAHWALESVLISHSLLKSCHTFFASRSHVTRRNALSKPLWLNMNLQLAVSDVHMFRCPMYVRLVHLTQGREVLLNRRWFYLVQDLRHENGGKSGLLSQRTDLPGILHCKAVPDSSGRLSIMSVLYSWREPLCSKGGREKNVVKTGNMSPFL